MKNKYYLLLFLILPIIFLVSWITSLHFSKINGQEVIIRMHGFDPVDLLSGHYLYLRPDWQHTDCGQFTDQRCPTELFEKRYRYYLPEHDAQTLDRKIVAAPELPIDVVFILRENAVPLADRLLINGLPWQKWKLNQSAEQLSAQ